MSATQIVRPAVVFSLGFVYEWKIGGYDFMEYMSRPEAFCSDNHIDDEEYNPKTSFKGSDFLTYMSNEEKSDGLFDSTRELLDDNDKEVYRAYEMQSRTEGCPKYYGVMSFDNEFLVEHGLLSPDGKHLDSKQLKELGREGINALIHSNPKFEDSNVYWNAAIHTNTDNVHIHYSICEYHRLEDRRQTTAGQDLIPISSFNKLKSVVANRIIGDEHLQRIQTARDEIRSQFAAKGIREQLAELLDILPDNILRSSKEQAGYNSRYVKRYQAAIQKVVKNIIGSDADLQDLTRQFATAVSDGQNLYRRIYGEGSQELYLNFSKNRYADLQERLGNEVLNGVRDLYYARCEHLSDSESLRHFSDLALKHPSLRPFRQEQSSMPVAPHLSDESSDTKWSWSYQEQSHPNPPDVYEPSDDDLEFLSSPDEVGGFHLNWSKSYKYARKLIYDKRSTAEDFHRAEQLLLSEGNNVLALDALAKLYATDKLGTKDTYLSEKYYARAFKGWQYVEPTIENNLQSYVWYRIGKCYCYGLGTQLNEEQAALWFTRAAEADNKYASFSLANLYYYGKGVEQSYEQAFKWYSQAAEKEQPYATYAIAQMYERGEYVKKNSEAAHEYYSAALQGFLLLEKKGQADDNLEYKIGKMYQDGKGTEKDVAKAVEYFKLAAKNENSRAQYELGKALILGDSIKQNVAEGMIEINKSITNGNDDAKSFLGRQLVSGKYITKNILKGIDLLTDCYSRRKSDMIAYAIGKAYLDPTVNDWEQGCEWLTRAAESGNQYAQLRLGYEYYRREQYNDAARWYAAAARKEFHVRLPHKNNRPYHYKHIATSTDRAFRMTLHEMQKNTARLISEFEREQAEDEYRMKMNSLGY